LPHIAIRIIWQLRLCHRPQLETRVALGLLSLLTPLSHTCGLWLSIMHIYTNMLL